MKTLILYQVVKTILQQNQQARIPISLAGDADRLSEGGEAAVGDHNAPKTLPKAPEDIEQAFLSHAQSPSQDQVTARQDKGGKRIPQSNGKDRIALPISSFGPNKATGQAVKSTCLETYADFVKEYAVSLSSN